jgi:hypothetical protein
LLIFLLLAVTRPCPAQIGGQPGAFSRLGFGARGMAMGNAMSAVTTGDVVAYYNPALLPGIGYRFASASFGILSLDRRLNFLNYSGALPPNAGLSIGLINAGVSEIDGRDGDGEPTGPLKISENQVFLGFGLRFPIGLSVGVTLKLYYYQLYTDVSSTTVGVDFGALYRFNEYLTAALTVRDINSRYKWDTRPVFGQNGLTSEEGFPRLYTMGAAYRLPDSIVTISAEVEFTSTDAITGRAGVEVPVVPEFTLRAGIDRLDLQEKGNGVRPSFGFTARTRLGGLSPALHYAVVLEPFAPTAMHMISLSVIF